MSVRVSWLALQQYARERRIEPPRDFNMGTLMSERMQCLFEEFALLVLEGKQHARIEEHVALDLAVAEHRRSHSHAHYDALGRGKFQSGRITPVKLKQGL